MVHVGIGPIYLVYSYHYGHSRCFGVINGFDSLWHNTIVSGNYQDGNIGYLCSVSSHGSKCFMTGSIQKSNFLVIDHHLISADMLGDTTCFGFHHAGLPYGIQQPGFTMVNMSHHSNYRRARFQVSGFFALELELFFYLAGSAGSVTGCIGFQLRLKFKSLGYYGSGFVVNHLVDIGNNAASH